MYARWIAHSLVVLLGAVLARAQTPLGTEFTYQGRLKDGGRPANGTYDLRFALFDQFTGGTQQGPTVCVDNVAVAEGLFTLQLDFGAQFAGQERFLEIDVRADTGLNCGSFTGFVTLVPRQELTAAPCALYALSGPGAGSWNASGNNIYNTNTGNVGIGNASPAARLDVVGTTRMTAFQMPTGAAAGKVLMSDAAGLGTWQNEAGLTLPFAGSVNSSSPAFQVTNTATSGSTTGVYGRCDSTSGWGVRGVANNSTAATAAGVMGESGSTSGRGVFGWAWATSGTTTGVWGNASSPDGRGVYGYAASPSGTTYGGRFESLSTSGIGAMGYAMATTGNAIGLWGRTDSTTGRGVYGLAATSSGFNHGVYGRADSSNGIGVFGEASAASGATYGGRFTSGSTTGYGVFAEATAASGDTFGGAFRSGSTSGIGVFGHASATSGSTYGVYGRCDSTSGRAVYGYAGAATGSARGGQFESTSTTGRGVYGIASANNGTNYGVFGQTSSGAGYGVYGTAVGAGTGVYGHSSSGTGVYGYSSSGYGGYFNTDVSGGAALYVEGTASVGVITIRGGADLAENFEVAHQPEQIQPGMVVMIDAQHPGGVTLARGAYNKCVAGVVSGANELQAGMVLGQFDGQKGAKPVALSGRVWTLVDASAAGVEPGDLLTTSDNPGHAMPVVDHAKAHGATIGKAMSRLGKGEKGLVLVLVNLQ